MKDHFLEAIMSINLRSVCLIGATCLLLPSLPSFGLAMEPENENPNANENPNIQSIHKMIKDDLISIFNSMDNEQKNKIINSRNNLKYIILDLMTLINKKLKNNEPLPFEYKGDPRLLALDIALATNSDMFLDTLNSTIDKISDLQLRNAIQFLVFKEKAYLTNNMADEESIKIDFFNKYIKGKLSDVDIAAMLSEGIKPRRGPHGRLENDKIVKIVLQTLRNRGLSDKDIIVELIKHKAINFNWLIQESSQFLIDKQVGLQDVEEAQRLVTEHNEQGAK